MDKVDKLPEILKKEWFSRLEFYSELDESLRFKEFEQHFENFEGSSINEFKNMSPAIHEEWVHWRYIKGYCVNFKTFRKEIGWYDKTFSQAWDEFKKEWQFDTEESKLMFKEMELLSKGMTCEWRFKYNFVYPHIYENNDSDYSKKTKAQLWKEFKEIWDIDISNYNEDKYHKMRNYIIRIECDTKDYFKQYPRNFFEYREDFNYHSFDSYSILEQYEICKQWDIDRRN